MMPRLLAVKYSYILRIASSSEKSRLSRTYGPMTSAKLPKPRDARPSRGRR